MEKLLTPIIVVISIPIMYLLLVGIADIYISILTILSIIFSAVLILAFLLSDIFASFVGFLNSLIELIFYLVITSVTALFGFGITIGIKELIVGGNLERIDTFTWVASVLFLFTYGVLVRGVISMTKEYKKKHFKKL